MADEFPEELRRKLTQYGQDHILRRWSDLTPAVRNRLLDQLRVLDLARLAALVETRRQKGNAPDNSLVERARRAVPPSSIVRLPQTADERSRWKEAHQAGEELLRAGKVGRDSRRRRAGDAARLRQTQGDVPGRTGQRRAAVSDPRRTSPRAVAPRGTADPVLHHDQRRDPRRDGRFLRGACTLRPCRGKTSISSSRGTCRRSMRPPANCSCRAIRRSATSPDGHGGMLAALDQGRAARRNETPRHRIPALPPGRQPDRHRL